MNKDFGPRFLLLALSSLLAFSSLAAEPAKTPDGSALKSAPTATPPVVAPFQASAPEVLEKPIPPFHPVSPGPADGRIAFVTAKMLEVQHYSKQPLEPKLAAKFFDHYIESYDPQHLHFLQSDLAEFEHYRTNLTRLTVTDRGVSDTRPACEIFNRYMERLQERVAYVEELLKNEKFTFDADERILINRKEAPYPRDLDEAKQLWRERLRYEYLQELLLKIDAKKKAEAAAKEKAAHPEKAAKTVAEKKTPAKSKTEAEEIADLLRVRYHRNLRAFVEWNNDDVMQTYLSSLARVYDPHTDYMGHAQLDQFGIAMNLSLFGIGAELGTEDGYCTIRRLLPGGPAIKSKKIHERDRIVAVAQPGQPAVDLVEMSLTKAVQLIRGPKGTEVILTLIPADADPSAREVLTLVRDEIKLEDQAAKATILDIPNGHGETNRLGVLDLPSFYAPIDLGGGRRPENGRPGDATSGSTTADVARLLAKMKQEKVNGIVLDLRRNGGGSLEEAIRLTGLFIKEGPVVQVRDSEGNKQVDEDTDPSVAYDGPLIVLTSRFSASASEILAGALQDYGRALIVGDASTHGKGTVQSVNSLKPYMRVNDTILTNDPGALKVTIKKFYRASGASTQLKGVVPDIILPSIWNESKDIGEASLDNALPYDTIPSAKYEHLDLVTPYLTELRKQSDQRLTADKDFEYVREDIDQFKKIQADKTISLNEKQRLKEKDEADARVKARDKERLARKESPEKKYELTLKDVNLPGLPPPVQKTNSTLVRFDHAKGAAAIVSAGSNPTASVTTAPAASPDTGVEDTPEDEKPPAVDPTLTEAERILLDYMSMFPKHNLLTSGH